MHDRKLRISRSGSSLSLLPLTLLLCTLFSGSTISQETGSRTPSVDKNSGRGTTVDVRVDRRVELLSIVAHLAGYREFSRGKVAAYRADVNKHFGPFKDHQVVRRAKVLRAANGISFDAVPGLAIHLEDNASFTPIVPLKPRPEDLDPRWGDDAQGFAASLAEFAKASNFEAFWKRHQSRRQNAEKGLRDLIEKRVDLDWFTRYFGERPRSRFRVVIGLLNGGHNYGPHVRRGETEELYAVMGAWLTDEEGEARFDSSVLPTLIHEFTHSYVNHLIDEFEAELRPAGETIYPRVAESMKKQAYANWQTMMKESLVRAGVVRYEYERNGAVAARKQARRDEQRDFLWIHELSRLLGSYEADRKKYPTMRDFMPRVVAFFNDYRMRKDKLINRPVPQVLSMYPRNGSLRVDPKLEEIVITFDTKMRDKSWSFVGGGETFPQGTGDISYDEKRQVLTFPVKLRPNQQYEFWLNRGRFNSFRSDEGVALKPVHVTFKTRTE